MEKRTILAILLIAIIYWFSATFLWKKPKSELKEENLEITVVDTSPVNDVNIIRDESLITLATTEHELEQVYSLENDKLRITFSNLGAVITQIELKEYFLKDKTTPVTLIPEQQAILQIDNFPLDLNNTIFKAVESTSDGIAKLTFTATWENRSNENLSLNHQNNDMAITQVSKIFHLDDSYHLDFYFEGDSLPALDAYSIALNSGINITESGKAAMKDIRNSFAFVSQIDREEKKVILGRLNKGPQNFLGKVNWAALRSKYFVMSIIPENRVMSQSITIQKVSETLGFDLFVKYNTRFTNYSEYFFLYLGPVDFDILKSYNKGLENIAELGWTWLRPLAKIFAYFILLLYKYIPNYGFVIIIFALILKIILTPLTNKSINSAREMQKIQPLLREIQTKYKNDPKKLQEEMRNLYKEHNINPLGGCLPLLLQMPIFIALLPVLRYSIEFRQAYFLGWLSDLSEPDPYWILPILMGIFMFIQQKMTQVHQDTSQMDEKQLAMMQSQKMMMYMMPPLMVFLFSSFPSGLVLYWTTFNIFSIIQQYFNNKRLKQKGEL